MSHHAPDQPIRIQTPCPMQWSELVGDDRRRHCGRCALDVHNLASLTRKEANELVSGARQRLCMRIEHDAQGRPVYRDPRPRVLRWLGAAAASVLAACTGGSATATPAPAAGAPPSRMGQVCSTAKVGDVALPPQPPQPDPGTLRPTLGEVALPSDPKH